MLLGYNQTRPTEENYRDFQEKLVAGLKELDIPGLSLMIFGSYIRGKYDVGRSDVDAVMVFPDDVVIDKKNLAQAAIVLHKALKGNPVPFQVSVSDLTTMKEGRFNTYDESFKDYFFDDTEAIVIGTDYREKFRYELPTMNEQIPVRFNLRKSRTGLLFAEHDRHEDEETFLRKFTKTMDSASRASKQILYFMDGTLRKERFAAEDLIADVFPEIDITPLSKIRRMYKDPPQIDEIYKKPEEVMQLWNATVTFFEEMVRGFIRKFPREDK
jgi:predicted nucleotidyltransferase